MANVSFKGQKFRTRYNGPIYTALYFFGATAISCSTAQAARYRTKNGRVTVRNVEKRGYTGVEDTILIKKKIFRKK